MTIKRTMTSITATAVLAATTLAPVAASAEPWNHNHGNNHAYSQRGDRGRGGDHGNWNGRGRHDFYAYRRHKHHNTGKYIALGIGALMLGIMASEAAHY